jgi:branched-chain amino acid aminotransferase
MNALPTHVSLNGRLIKAAQARISVFDRGFLYGDGLFETMRSYHGRVLGLSDHLQRLRASAALLELRLPRHPWRRHIDALLERCRLTTSDAAVRVTITRGAGVPGLVPPKGLTPTVLIVATPVAEALARQQRHGIKVVLLPFGREGFLAGHKTLDYLPAILGRTRAQRQGAQEALFVEGDRVTEATTANLFVVRRGRLLTPPLVGVLPGVTRMWIMEAARRSGIEAREGTIRTRTLLEADEVFLTSSVVEVLPVTSIGDRRIGSGKVGSVTQVVQSRYRQMADQASSVRPSR